MRPNWVKPDIPTKKLTCMMKGELANRMQGAGEAYSSQTVVDGNDHEGVSNPYEASGSQGYITPS